MKNQMQKSLLKIVGKKKDAILAAELVFTYEKRHYMDEYETENESFHLSLPVNPNDAELAEFIQKLSEYDHAFHLNEGIVWLTSGNYIILDVYGDTVGEMESIWKYISKPEIPNHLLR